MGRTLLKTTHRRVPSEEVSSPASPSRFRPHPPVPGIFSFRARVILLTDGPTRPAQRLPVRGEVPTFRTLNRLFSWLLRPFTNITGTACVFRFGREEEGGRGADCGDAARAAAIPSSLPEMAFSHEEFRIPFRACVVFWCSGVLGWRREKRGLGTPAPCVFGTWHVAVWVFGARNEDSEGGEGGGQPPIIGAGGRGAVDWR
jgi:hypothetical protein